MSDDEKPASTPEGPRPPAPSEPELPTARKHMPTMLGVGDEAAPAHERDAAAVATDAGDAAAPPVSEKRQQTGEWGSAGTILPADADEEAPVTETPVTEAPAEVVTVADSVAAIAAGNDESVEPVVETQPGPPVVLTPIADMLLAVDEAPADAAQIDDDDGAPEQETVPIALPPVAISSPREPIAKAIEPVEQDAAPEADATQELDAETVPIVPPGPPSARPIASTPPHAAPSPPPPPSAQMPDVPPPSSSAPVVAAPHVLAPTPTPTPAPAPPAYAVPTVAPLAARAATAPKPGLSIVGLLLVLGVFSAAALVFLHRDEFKDQPVAPATSASSPSMSPEPTNPASVVVTVNEPDAGAAPIGSAAIVERPKLIPKKKAKPKASAGAASRPPAPLPTL